MNKKIRILHAIGNLSMGGAEQQCRLLTNNLNTELFEVSIICFNEGPNPEVLPHIKVIFIDRESKYNIYKTWKRVDEVISIEKPDVIQAWVPEVISFPATISGYRRRIPVISAHRNTITFEGNWKLSMRDWLRFPQHLFASTIVSNFDIVEEPKFVRSIYRIKSGRCIYNGLDEKFLQSIPQKKLPNQATYRLIFSGRLVPQKGLPVVLNAIRILLDQGCDVHLTIFGTGPQCYKDKLLAVVVELNIGHAVTFYGECPNWHAYASDATAMVFPTLAEGTSNSVLEALSVGLPIIISDIAMSRFFFTSYENAIVIKSREAVDWANELLKLFKSNFNLNQLAKKGKDLAKNFSLSSMVSSYEDLYRKLYYS